MPEVFRTARITRFILSSKASCALCCCKSNTIYCTGRIIICCVNPLKQLCTSCVDTGCDPQIVVMKKLINFWRSSKSLESSQNHCFCRNILLEVKINMKHIDITIRGNANHCFLIYLFILNPHSHCTNIWNLSPLRCKRSPWCRCVCTLMQWCVCVCACVTKEKQAK